MSTKFKAEDFERAVVFLGVGHGGDDPGAVGVLREEDVNLMSAIYAKNYLVAEGITVIMSRTKDENDPLTEEIREANASGADCAVDMHANAGGGDGFEAYHTWNSSPTGGKLLATYIESHVKAIGQNSRGCKTRRNSSGADYYGFIRQTKMTAVILEACFVDNKKDAKQFDTNAELKKYGEAVAKGIIAWLDATGKLKEAPKKKPATTTKPATKKPATTGVKYYKKCKQNEDSLVDGLKYIGVSATYSNRAKIAKKNGLKSYSGSASQNKKLLTLLKSGKLKK